MRPNKLNLPFLSCLVLSISVVVLNANAASPSELARVPLLLFKPPAETATIFNKTDQDYIDYAWRSFIALNWPAMRPLGGENRGQPNVSDGTYPGSAQPLVWETWPYTDQVFLPSGNWMKAKGHKGTTDYPTWRQLPVTPSFPLTDQDGKITSYQSPPPPPCASTAEKEGALLLQAINQPGESIKHGPVGPLYDQNGYAVRYQVGLNRSYFEYVRAQEYYQAEKQVPPPSFVALPQDEPGKPGMIEYKSAWKVLDEEEQKSGRFYTRKAFFVSLPWKKDASSAVQAGECFTDGAGKPVSFTVGLVAFHIHRVTYFGHVAMTFESVDNVRIGPSRFDFPSSIPTPSFNPGWFSKNPPPYGKKGFSGEKPDVISVERDSRFHVKLDKGKPPDVSRATPIPLPFRQANARYRALMRRMGSVFQHYQLIGTQHVSADCSRDWVSGKWSPGCPGPNLDILINAALESYTQLVNLNGQLQNYSCKGCHQSARPCGVSWSAVPDYKSQLMSFLLSKANKKSTGYQEFLSGYNCNQ